MFGLRQPLAELHTIKAQSVFLSNTKGMTSVASYPFDQDDVPFLTVPLVHYSVELFVMSLFLFFMYYIIILCFILRFGAAAQLLF